jgi:hypothetical protein
VVVLTAAELAAYEQAITEGVSGHCTTLLILTNCCYALQRQSGLLVAMLNDYHVP